MSIGSAPVAPRVERKLDHTTAAPDPVGDPSRCPWSVSSARHCCQLASARTNSTASGSAPACIRSWLGTSYSVPSSSPSVPGRAARRPDHDAAGGPEVTARGELEISIARFLSRQGIVIGVEAAKCSG
jgi:hypothetical protein